MSEATTDELRELLPITEVPRSLPGRPHMNTIYRWVKKGIRGQRLKVVSVGGLRCTTTSWLMDFFDRVERSREEQGLEPETISPRRRDRQCKEATDSRATVAILKRHGLG